MSEVRRRRPTGQRPSAAGRPVASPHNDERSSNLMAGRTARSRQTGAPPPRGIPGPRAAGSQSGSLFVAVMNGDPNEADVTQDDFLAQLNNVKAVPVPATASALAPVNRDMVRSRGYQPDDLMAVASVGYHYLICGNPKLAEVIFSGLAAIEPREAYFALALGLTNDRMQRPDAAQRWYQQASRLDPHDGRPDINRAELMLSQGRRDEATRLLQRGLAKAEHQRDSALEDKARAILDYVSANWS